MHSFKLGDLVRIAHGDPHAARGIYEIVRLLPASEDGEPLYHVKSTEEAHARMVREHQLSQA